MLYNTHTKFAFYTYDAKGRDITVTIYALNNEAARAKFDSQLGKDAPVDWVKEI